MLSGTKHREPFDYDVVIATDCRLPGGTVSSTVEEITAQAKLRLRTGLIHVDSKLVSRTRPLNPLVRASLDRGDATLVLPGESVTAQLALIRHPTVALGLNQPAVPRVVARAAMMLVNQTPVTGADRHYRASEVSIALREWLGFDPIWAPIGPLVRQAFVEHESDQPLSNRDWVNIIDVDAWAVEREPIDHSPIRIGRHSRDHRLKWPSTRAELVAAYPIDGEFDVNVLGGARYALDVLGGKRPACWTIHRFGSIHPREFLQKLDVFVYLHHPDLTEAFGRTILEAMASGLPVLTDRRFHDLFGDALIYVEPEEVVAELRRLARDSVHYMYRSAIGQQAARERFGYQQHQRRLADLGVENAAEAEIVHGVDRAVDPGDRRTSVLFISPNGAGMGHLTRVMAVARRLPADVDRRFFTFSTAAAIVEQQGQRVDYSPSRPVTRSSSSGWHQSVDERLTDVLARHRPDVIVIDGTDPYRGILRALARHPDIAVVWMRRGMWKRGVSNAVLAIGSQFFDRVIEPGDRALDNDRGATRSAPDATVVAPITYLSDSEMASRDEARQYLGLASGERAVLLNLGAGNINDTSGVLRTCVDRLGDAEGVRVFAVQSPIAVERTGLADRVTAIDVYPLSKYLRGFDFCVAAAGYNSFHEVLAAGLPTAFVPNDETITDDQRGRAQWADEQGVAICMDDETPAEVCRALDRLSDKATIRSIRERLSALERVDGAAEAASILMSLTDQPADIDARSDVRSSVLKQMESASIGGSNTRDVSPAGGGRHPNRRAALGRGARSALERVRRRVGDTRLRAMAQLLPSRVERRLRRTLGLPTGKVSSKAKPAMLNTPVGVALGNVDPAALERVLLVVGAAISNEDVVTAVAERQTIERTFAPVFLTTSLEASAFRRQGYVWEHVAAFDPATESVDQWVDRHQQRISQIRRWYDIDITVGICSVEEVRSNSSILAHLVRDLDPTKSV